MTRRQEIDYRALMVKYMAHVCEFEGTTYVRDDHRGRTRVRFTDEEFEALSAMDRESEKL
jgi:hypothetical protein